VADQVTRSEAPDLVLVEHPARRRGPDGAPVEPPELLGGVALVTLNRPRALNALSFDLLLRLAEAVEALDADPTCGAIVITGAGTRAFAAGADVAELAAQTSETLAASPGFRGWDRVAAVATPTIAAVRGFALGGGAELAMACDMLVAADDATFGQPEISLGIIPGAGGTQRLARAIGKARAMELVLTGRRIGAAEAERLGFVTRVVPAAETLGAALDLGATVAAQPAGAVRAAVAAVRAAFEGPLADGMRVERDLFGSLFGTPDQVEGMRAFVERREPRWRAAGAIATRPDGAS
jgi:enoyl-CoA hydratase